MIILGLLVRFDNTAMFIVRMIIHFQQRIGSLVLYKFDHVPFLIMIPGLFD